MIPQAFITEWANRVPWQTNEQVEQDLVICRALVEIFTDDLLSGSLAFRGGTALHKLFIHPQTRYSEDIDLVQMRAEPFGPIADRLRERLYFLGSPVRKQKENGFTLLFRFESEFPPAQNLRLKVETNSREHFSVLGYMHHPFRMESSWYSGSCSITTYRIEELLGTKLRALYQRRKGRDLYDMYMALTRSTELDMDALLSCYHAYMSHAVDEPPSGKVFLQNLEAKMKNEEFIGDTRALLRPTVDYDPTAAFHILHDRILTRLDEAGRM
jgi:predicted nucleotidyltransferase component of viral defense system